VLAAAGDLAGALAAPAGRERRRRLLHAPACFFFFHLQTLLLLLLLLAVSRHRRVLPLLPADDVAADAEAPVAHAGARLGRRRVAIVVSAVSARIHSKENGKPCMGSVSDMMKGSS